MKDRVHLVLNVRGQGPYPVLTDTQSFNEEWVLVPAKPTEAMMLAARIAFFEGDKGLEQHMRPGPTPRRILAAYEAALAAAPVPPIGKE